MKNIKGWVRLGMVGAGLLVIGFILPSLKIYQFTPFNSGVSIIIGLSAAVWMVYSIFTWVVEGFKN